MFNAGHSLSGTMVCRQGWSWLAFWPLWLYSRFLKGPIWAWKARVCSVVQFCVEKEDCKSDLRSRKWKRMRLNPDQNPSKTCKYTQAHVCTHLCARARTGTRAVFQNASQNMSILNDLDICEDPNVTFQVVHHLTQSEIDHPSTPTDPSRLTLRLRPSAQA